MHLLDVCSIIARCWLNRVSRVYSFGAIIFSGAPWRTRKLQFLYNFLNSDRPLNDYKNLADLAERHFSENLFKKFVDKVLSNFADRQTDMQKKTDKGKNIGTEYLTVSRSNSL